MRAAFLGTPAAAVPSLAALADVADIAAVITRPDRARGRSGKPVPPPVKRSAEEWGFPVLQPATKEELYRMVAALGLCCRDGAVLLRLSGHCWRGIRSPACR